MYINVKPNLYRDWLISKMTPTYNMETSKFMTRIWEKSALKQHKMTSETMQC